ncbi:MAG TPA: XrtA system polysaccharide chain length determinant [Aquabacterium sp.]|uniref:XrtA system polysaccharide chain length determinant n=1 Tax=Aquabacterium sp. TaxID=1872578 RepID=UPI002E343D0C|nr:XrtA system polysaccharide chain length determinant [Aquabacterium sp.]HEX5358047.1 XrtA system polysaccharide chain length determinant [Aquabacterium sp.]
MDDTLRQVSSILIAMWQRRWVGVAVAWVIAFLGAGVVYVMRDRYEASARVFVDTQTVLKPLMNGLAFQPDVDQQVRMIARTLISRPNIERLIQSPRIGLQYLSEADREKIIDRFTKEIKVAPSGDANLFAITYRDINPQRAQRVVEDLVALFVSSGVVDKQRDSEQARQFLDDQIKSYELKLTEAENRLKDFKIKNFGLTGTSNQDYFARMSTSSDEVSRLRVELQAAEQARDALRRELANEDPTMPAEASGLPVQSPTAETDARLDAQKRQLDELMRRYTDEHPDVVAVRRSIAQLEQQRRAELDARAKAGNGKLKPAPTSPVFQKIRVTLAEAEAKVASLRGQLGAQQGQLDQARTMASRMPAVEAELAQLNRDYDVVRKNYEQLVTRRESASLGEKIDQTTKVAEFRVVEPPRVSPTPAKPSRMLVALASIAAALLGGAAATFGLSQVFPSVYDARQLKEISGRPVLGSVSLVVGPAIHEQARRNNRVFAGAMAIFLMANVGWLIAVKQHMLP